MAQTAVSLTSASPTTPWYDAGQTTSGRLSLQLTGTWTGTVTFETCVAGQEANAVTVTAIPTNSATGVTTTTANGVWDIDLAGRKARANFSTATSGTVVVTPSVVRS
jgi:hypothetical protein